ncbi:MAG: OmpH family outer membrane protein [Bacteroidia bacterium]|nr:OmpH family outer membrane protein [Bacteroidia bacterium]
MTKTIGLLLVIVLLIFISLFTYHSLFTKKMAYVDIPKVFNSFEMKKELQEKYKQTEAGRKRVLDSLSFNLQTLAKKINENKNDKNLIAEFDSQRDMFFKTKKRFEEDNEVLSRQYDKQILEQMSQYILDYGKQNRYDLILGADGNGTLMYANEEMNISDLITNYINNKYKGLE